MNSIPGLRLLPACFHLFLQLCQRLQQRRHNESPTQKSERESSRERTIAGFRPEETANFLFADYTLGANGIASPGWGVAISQRGLLFGIGHSSQSAVF
jgi:hypothetical protein